MVVIAWEDLNWVAILVVIVWQMALGFLWYAPFGFGKMWMKMAGLTGADTKKNRGPAMAGITLATVVLALGLAILVQWTAADTAMDGAFVGGVAAVFLALPVIAGDYLFIKVNKGLVINGFFNALVGWVVSGVILAVM